MPKFPSSPTPRSQVNFGNPVPYATSFPQVIHSGASFNATLWHIMGQIVGTEGRWVEASGLKTCTRRQLSFLRSVFNNQGHAGLTFWAPNVNEIPDPR